VPQGHGDRPHPDGMAPSGPPPSHLGHSFGAPGFQPGAADRPRYSPQYFPHQIRPAQHYHWGGGQQWRGQPGFYYHHWRYGEFLPGGWFGADFWINDWGDYDLPVPPYGYEWVRVGADALLVDTYSGEVVSTVYGLFY
jgi:Ni/Co efflux regulator RcnB